MEGLVGKGGWIMIPILLGSIVALALVLERLWFFWSIRLNVAEFADEIYRLVDADNLAEATDLCHKTQHPIAEVFRAGLERSGEDAVEIDKAMEREANRQMQWVEKNLGYLLMIVGIEPMMGFLGTILGLIQAFMAWEKLAASVTVSALAAGIYQAMLTTAAGLMVAIPYFVIYHLFLGQVNNVAQDLNHYGDGLTARLHRISRIRS